MNEKTENQTADKPKPATLGTKELEKIIEEMKKMKLPQLKKLCRDNGLSTSGKKEELRKRLFKAMGAETEYAFPTKSRCPRCNSTQTTAYSTNGNIQYRRCLMAVCRNTYTVRGREI